MAKKTTDGNVIFKSKIEPFSIGKQDEKFFILIANNLVSKRAFIDQKSAEDYIMRKPYELIFNGMLALMKMLEEQKDFFKTHEVKKTQDDETITVQTHEHLDGDKNVQEKGTDSLGENAEKP